ncbi:fimbrial biogenesis chaperone [Bartonella sp. LJL80]
MAMMRLLISITLYLFAVMTVHGATITILPLMLDVKPPMAAGQITLRVGPQNVVQAQARIYRWAQKDGKDVYTPTSDVVISPPFLSMKPNSDTILRVVRTSKTPITSEESYRVFIDELPQANVTAEGKVSDNGVKVVTRNIVPVFFGPKDSEPRVNWSVRRGNGGFILRGVNHGSQRLRLANVKLLSSSGAVVGQIPGLAGYVLAGSQADIFVKAAGGGSPAKISAQGNKAVYSAPIGAGK